MQNFVKLRKVITRQRNILRDNSHSAQESVCTQFTFLITTGKCKCLKELTNKKTKNKFIKTANKCTWIYECNFITLESHTNFGHSHGHLQGGENKNTNTIMKCQNHSTVKNHIVLGFLTVE